MAWQKNKTDSQKQYAYSEIVGGLYCPPDKNSKVIFRGSFDVEALHNTIEACEKESATRGRINIKVVESSKSDACLIFSAMGERNGGNSGGGGSRNNTRTNAGGSGDARGSFKDKWDKKPPAEEPQVDDDDDDNDDVVDEEEQEQAPPPRTKKLATATAKQPAKKQLTKKQPTKVVPKRRK